MSVTSPNRPDPHQELADKLGITRAYAMKHAKFHEWYDEGKFERLIR